MTLTGQVISGKEDTRRSSQFRLQAAMRPPEGGTANFNPVCSYWKSPYVKSACQGVTYL
ncbi:hypothetical protein QUF80_20955 [Desulfococcaceae bacterium HSG8]|nr:hypothetical protein [Desulfococcaceae bacterium HSG8]